MALLPPIPDRPADRPETWSEYLSRRAMVAMHRQFSDELAAWSKTGDSIWSGILQVENLNIDLAPELKELIEPPKRTGGLPMSMAYGARRMPTNLL
jgi:hypothetical protein